MNKAKRKFFKDYFVRGTINIIQETLRAFEEEKATIQKETATEEYFQSFESAYPLISETMLFMDDEVKELGINTTGKNNLEIVKDIYSKRNEK